MSTDAMRLPEPFRDLEPLVPRWTAAGMSGRLRIRIESSAAERSVFYAAMAPRAEAILEQLNGQDIDALMPDAERLMSLMLTLAEISLSEEVIGQAIEPIHARGNAIMQIDKELDGR